MNPDREINPRWNLRSKCGRRENSETKGKDDEDERNDGVLPAVSDVDGRQHRKRTSRGRKSKKCSGRIQKKRQFGLFTKGKISEKASATKAVGLTEEQQARATADLYKLLDLAKVDSRKTSFAPDNPSSAGSASASSPAFPPITNGCPEERNERKHATQIKSRRALSKKRKRSRTSESSDDIASTLSSSSSSSEDTETILKQGASHIQSALVEKFKVLLLHEGHQDDCLTLTCRELQRLHQQSLLQEEEEEQVERERRLKMATEAFQLLQEAAVAQSQSHHFPTNSKNCPVQARPVFTETVVVPEATAAVQVAQQVSTSGASALPAPRANAAREESGSNFPFDFSFALNASALLGPPLAPRGTHYRCGTLVPGAGDFVAVSSGDEAASGNEYCWPVVPAVDHQRNRRSIHLDKQPFVLLQRLQDPNDMEIFDYLEHAPWPSGEQWSGVTASSNCNSATGVCREKAAGGEKSVRFACEQATPDSSGSPTWRQLPTVSPFDGIPAFVAHPTPKFSPHKLC